MGISITGSQGNKASGLATQVFEMKEDAGRADYMQLIREKMDEMQEKIDSGNIRPSFATGAQSYTVQEWDKLLRQFDKSEKVLQEAQRDEIEERTGQKQREVEERSTGVLNHSVLGNEDKEAVL